MFKPNDKVCFSRSAMEFVGTVVSASADKVVVSGVEVGCLAMKRSTVDISHLSSLRVLSDEEFQQMTLEEPAFADNMPKERFLELQKELTSLKNSADSSSNSFQIQVIESLLANAPISAYVA